VLAVAGLLGGSQLRRALDPPSAADREQAHRFVLAEGLRETEGCYGPWSPKLVVRA
jgi:hypothetical protein